ncbi:MAG TPA: lysylphosphatidylglycerol synthase transmembrane domain-containing protein [Conexibacter sp.]|nr:lysylphosphatidylglycerol synthase transmembrane domain-containing protein [Conexibacter sp.]
MVQTPETTAAAESRRLRTAIVWVLVAIALVAALLVAVPDLRAVGRRITHMDPRWLALAVAFELLACVGYVLVFRLTFPSVPARLANHLAAAQLAFGAALPFGGVGGLAFGAWVLRREGMGARELAERSAVLYLLTSGVNALVLLATALALGTGLLSGPEELSLWLVPAAAVCGVLLLVLLAGPLARVLARHTGRRRRLGAALDSYAAALGETVRLARRPSWGLLGAFLYLACDVGALWACAQGIGSAIPWASISLSYQVGQLATWVPIPGAVGALDGGIIGMLLVYDAPAATAAAAVLVYHALMFWIRTLLGGAAFLMLRRETH